MADRGQVEQIVHESRGQCAGRHADRRDPDDRDGERRPRRALRGDARRASKPGPYVVLTVTDTGTGMTPRGAGASVRAVLHDQGGRQRHRPRPRHGPRHRHAVAAAASSVDSEVGKGTSFTVYLPAGDAAASRRAPRRRCARAARGGETVLVVDDADGAARSDEAAAASARAIRVLRSPRTRTRRCSCSSSTRRSTCCSPTSSCRAPADRN